MTSQMTKGRWSCSSLWGTTGQEKACSNSHSSVSSGYLLVQISRSRSSALPGVITYGTCYRNREYGACWNQRSGCSRHPPQKWVSFSQSENYRTLQWFSRPFHVLNQGPLTNVFPWVSIQHSCCWLMGQGGGALIQQMFAEMTSPALGPGVQ